MTGVIMRNERHDELLAAGLGILQRPEVAFSLDAVLLANFVSVRPGDRVLDLGTGTGVVPLLLAAKTPADRIIGLEILPEIAVVARRNVLDNGLAGRLRELRGEVERNGFDARRVRMVHPHEGVPAKLVLIEAGLYVGGEARPGVAPGVGPEWRFLPPLVIQAADGSYTTPLQRVFDGTARLDDTP